MKKLVPAAACAAILLPLAVAQEGSDPGATQEAPHRLERVPPAEDPGTPDAVPSTGNIDMEQMVTLLTDPDLDQREGNFDSLVRAARRDPAVLRLLTEVSESRVDLDLAWTARLALREVRRAPRLSTLFDSDPFGLDPNPFGFDLHGFGLLDRGFPPMSSFLGPGSRGQESAIEIRQEPGQGFLLRIREKVNGEEKVREYRGETLEEILEANPDLRAEMDLRTEKVPGGLRFLWGSDPTGTRLDQFLEELRRRPADPFAVFGDPRTAPLQEFLHPLRSSRPLETKILGVRVSEVSPDRAKTLGLEPGLGLYVAGVEPGTLAHLLGVGQGSVLLEINDRPILAPEDITETLARRGEKDPVHLMWVDGSGERRSNTWRPSE